jgi:large subunit ribosomal protein L3
MRTGVLAKKVGMSSVFDDIGRRIPVTLLQLENCQVIGRKTEEKDGYNALILGAFDCKASKINKPQKTLFDKAKILPKAHVAEFRVSDDAFIEDGAMILANHFIPGQYVDVRGTTIGKGFAGVMKRYNFRGLRASHGVSLTHRSHGSTGQRQDPGKVMKGKKMAGHMGNKLRTIQNLVVVDIDVENNLIIVKGSVPSHKGAIVKVFDSIKKALPNDAPYPCFKSQAQGQVNQEEHDEVKKEG